MFNDATHTTIKPQHVQQVYDNNGRYTSSINYCINNSTTSKVSTSGNSMSSNNINNHHWKSALHVLLTNSLPGVHKVGATMGMNVFNISSHCLAWHRTLSYINEYVMFVYEACVKKLEADRRGSEYDEKDGMDSMG